MSRGDTPFLGTVENLSFLDIPSWGHEKCSDRAVLQEEGRAKQSFGSGHR